MLCLPVDTTVHTCLFRSYLPLPNPMAPSAPAADIAVGGKGANQAVAVARLAAGTGRTSRFVCQFGNDAHAAMMEKALVAEGVDVSASGHVDLPSGNGIVSANMHRPTSLSTITPQMAPMRLSLW